MSKILIVDDAPDIVDMTSRVLLKDGHEMMVAGDGEECLEILKKDRPDLILLDIMIPKIDGWDVCKIIKTDKKTKDIPVVFFTVLSSIEDTRKGLEWGDAWVEKPFKPKRLCEVINSFLHT